MGRSGLSSVAFAAAFAVMVIGIFIALGGLAYAASGTPSSASDQYGTKVKDVTVSVRSETESTSAVAEALPNTGLSLFGTAVVGGGLVALGVALRRRERRKD